jgi:Holliday junction resolvasome RuvABC endonuclease subunit
MRVLGIDPGPNLSGVCLIDYKTDKDWEIVFAEKATNSDVKAILQDDLNADVAIEGMVYQGQGFGASSIETCYQIGWFMAIAARENAHVFLYSRREYGRHFVPEGTLNDSSLRAGLEDCFGSFSCKIAPLYPLRGATDKRSAFAVAMYHAIKTTSSVKVKKHG